MIICIKWYNIALYTGNLAIDNKGYSGNCEIKSPNYCYIWNRMSWLWSILFIEITARSLSLQKCNIKLSIRNKNKVYLNCKQVTSKYQAYNTQT